MARYTEQKEFSFGSNADYSAIIPDSGASVQIEFWNGDQYIESSGSPVTTDDLIFTRNMRVRLTPAGGGFFIDEGAAL